MMRSIKDKLVAISGASKRRSGILDDARPTSEDDTATTLELFFALVYVFAMTQVTGYMVHAHDALGVLQGLLVLALLWWPSRSRKPGMTPRGASTGRSYWSAPTCSCGACT